MKLNEEYETKILRLNNEGEGVGKVEADGIQTSEGSNVCQFN